MSPLFSTFEAKTWTDIIGEEKFNKLAIYEYDKEEEIKEVEKIDIDYLKSRFFRLLSKYNLSFMSEEWYNKYKFMDISINRDDMFITESPSMWINTFNWVITGNRELLTRVHKEWIEYLRSINYMENQS